MSEISPEHILRAASTPRWAALTALEAVSADLRNYDRRLIREPRLLVPVDVQALVVQAGINDGETMVRLPFRDTEAIPPLDVRDPGTPRPPGVHLLWSAPAALGNGTLVDNPLAPGDESRRRLDLPALPDRWVVLRLAVIEGARDPIVTGWVIDATAATVTPLPDYPAVTTNTQTLGTAVTREQLTMQVGGPGWAQCYDAALGRLAFHDPLTDLAGTAVEGDAISYVVAGWWTDSADDPLDGVGTDSGYRARLDQLGWNDPDHPSPADARRNEANGRHKISQLFGMTSVTRYSQDIALRSGKAPTGGFAAGRVASAAEMISPAISGFMKEVVAAAALPPAPTRTTLLHGRIHGIPLRREPIPDNRPAASALRSALGASTSDVAATMAVEGTGLGTASEEARRAAERLLAAFSAGLMVRLRQTDTWADIDAYEHTRAFGTLPGGTEGIDRFVDKPAAGTDPGSGFRPGKKISTKVPIDVAAIEATVLWSAVERPYSMQAMSFTGAATTPSAQDTDSRPGAVPPAAGATVREVARPAPRFHQPGAPVLAVVGGGRTLTAVEREEATGELICRLSDQVDPGHTGLLTGAELLSTIGSAAVPDEVLGLARESLAEDPNLSRWRTRLADKGGNRGEFIVSRFRAEAALSYAYYAADNERLSSYTGAAVSSASSRQRATEALTRSSLSAGVWSHPEGVTQWGQPWRPMFCDWEVTIELGGLTGWELGSIDLDPGNDPLTPVTMPDSLVLQGRSGLVTGAAATLAGGINRWLTEERARDLGGHGLAEPATEAALSGLRDSLSRLDLMSVAIDGIREQLLGLSYDRGLVERDADALPDGTTRALALALPRLVGAGRLTLTAARLVDAFGRLLDLPLNRVVVSARVADTDPAAPPSAMRIRPRLTAASRWRFDLVDATSTSTDAALANVDQSDPAAQVTPIAGFLLPDHMDESLEVFSAEGRPLGELLHDPFSDAVSWEIAPGRTDVAPGAGPTEDTDTRNHRVGWIAAGLVAADATSRQGTPDRTEPESALSAMLRAIDTTLWTVDPFGSLGREHIAGLVGRPIAVVAARLALDVQEDTETLVYADGALRTGRAAAYADLAQLNLEVRLGEVTRSDDGLLGYFVEDDYTHFHLVDRVIAAQALPSGRCRGVLATEGQPPDQPVPIDHPYVDASGVLRIHPGQTVRLTLLMHPGGKVHLTSGILPRTSRTLSRDWVAPGLTVLAPSLRVGPLLIDADKVRLPKVASFPAEQLFTRRDTPTTWKDDPILAATQSALLPDTAPEVQEGWIRIAPNQPAEGATP